MLNAVLLENTEKTAARVSGMRNAQDFDHLYDNALSGKDNYRGKQNSDLSTCVKKVVKDGKSKKDAVDYCTRLRRKSKRT